MTSSVTPIVALDVSSKVAALDVMSELGGRTVVEALDSGWEAKDVWRVVCSVMNVPRERH